MSEYTIKKNPKNPMKPYIQDQQSLKAYFGT